MTKFANKTFTVPYCSGQYRQGWERVFGKPVVSPEELERRIKEAAEEKLEQLLATKEEDNGQNPRD